MTGAEVGIVIGIAAGIAGVATAAAKLAQWALRHLRRLFRLVDDLLGVPGDRNRPGLMAKVDDNIARLKSVEAITAELLPNGGGSVRDVLDRLDDRTERVEQRLAAVERLVIPDRTDEEGP